MMKLQPFVRWFINLVWPQRTILDKNTLLWAEHLVRLEQVELAEAEAKSKEEQEKQNVLSEKEAQIKLAMDFFSWDKANSNQFDASTPAWSLIYHVKKAMYEFSRVEHRSYSEEFERLKGRR